MAKSYGFRKDGSELKTQWETILYYLQEQPGRSVTAWEVWREFGFTRLSGIVKQIEYRTGIWLCRKDVQVTTRYGAKVLVTEYWYAEPKKNDEAK